MANSPAFRTVDIERRGYGRRYSVLPVDSLARTGFSIDCTGGYITPAMLDIRVGDIVRWRDGERLVQATIVDVQRHDLLLLAVVEGAELLPPEAFYP